MYQHYELRKKFKGYTRELAKLREALAAGDGEAAEAINNVWQWRKTLLRENYKRFVTIFKYTKELFWQCKRLQEEVDALKKARDKYLNDIARRQAALGRQKLEADFTPKQERDLILEVKRRQEDLVQKKKAIDKLEQEYLIKQDELEISIKETNLAKTSYYHLSDAEIALFEKDRPKILAGVEKYGSVAAALKNDASIKSRLSSILYHAKKHRQFGEDIAIAQQCFRDRLDAEIVDRAINGTVNPVFQRGEYIGDYATKDNKLLVEVAKAKLPEQYNPRAYAQANPQGPVGTTINILSFDGVDETKRGYAKNIGVVKSVDDTGRVERITQAKKMLEFYEKKEGAEIIDAEVVGDGE